MYKRIEKFNVRQRTLWNLIAVVMIISGCGSDDDNALPLSTATTVLTGKATFDLVPHRSSSNSLDYAATSPQPIRGAVVELLDSSRLVVQTTISTASGDYRFEVSENSDVRIRVRAQLLSGGTPAWDYQVLDNTNGGALYVLESAQVTTVGTAMEHNVSAASGWNGSSYADTRAAAPFAILDTVYQSMQKVLAVAPDIEFPSLHINWSVNNRSTLGDESTGEIGTSFYTRENNQSAIFLLGAANADTDEYDRHVVAHEWVHYVEDRFGRSDSLGGSHGGGDRLDPRVAFSEGLGYAMAGMLLDDPNVIDTLGFDQAAGFNINVENNTVLNPGWFSEGSAQAVLYDLYDSNDDDADNLALGFAPIFNTLTGDFAAAVPLTTIFAFVEALKATSVSDTSSIERVVTNQSTASVNTDAYGSNETNSAGNRSDVLPLYTVLPLDGSAITLCSLGGQSGFGHYNKLSNRRFLRFSLPTTGAYTIRAVGPAGSDPDIVLHQNGLAQIANLEESPVQSLSRNFLAGDYVVELYEYSNTTESPIGRTCFTVTASAD